jgi:iron-sulfur cluster assembly accessory protein
MLQQIDTQILNLTPAASRAVKDILTQRGLDGYALRIFVASGGCCGVNFGMALDNNFRDVDTTFETDGVKVVVDEVSIEYLRQATIDFVDDPQHGSGFAVNSPNLGSKDHTHPQGGCACGGSCACSN